MAAVAGLGCASGQSGPEDPGPRDPVLQARATVFETVLATRDGPPPPGALRIRLAFGAAADLDLYVTDPLQESVYFARRESRSGARLLRDERCDDPTPRIETVLVPRPRPGTYRIGVDYPESCSTNEPVVAYALQVDFGIESLLRRRRIQPRRFDPIVWEIVVPDPEAAREEAGPGEWRLESR